MNDSCHCQTRAVAAAATVDDDDDAVPDHNYDVRNGNVRAPVSLRDEVDLVATLATTWHTVESHWHIAYSRFADVSLARHNSDADTPTRPARRFRPGHAC